MFQMRRMRSISWQYLIKMKQERVDDDQSGVFGPYSENC